MWKTWIFVAGFSSQVQSSSGQTRVWLKFSMFGIPQFIRLQSRKAMSEL
ncbi:hypothetical protein HMPREF0293_2197 [Corynebacterium glucuronolyticum ATCC 51866]|uniref:Uncharacterized protein n=1 Tax=Corynebacterium glucuronolyticum ATCC 51866 TaxID=548478 RepID=A0ABP2DWS9_9CORY|nr:hypothetical protein HMPREF0293_2197 [Corynebacterium glucuronolyticum ATCC 51866]